MRPLRVAGGAAAGLVLVLVLAIWQGPRLLDWDRYRGAIAGAASSALGRPVRIAGPVSLALLPHPVLVAAGVTLADPGDGISAEVAELRVQAAIGPLLAGRLEAEDFTLYGADVRLPWPLRPGALQHAAPSGLHGQVEAATVVVGALALSGVAGTLAADPLTGTLMVEAQASALGWRWQVAARLGRAGGDGSVPLDVSLNGQDGGYDAASDTGGAVSGQIAADGSLTGRLTAHGRDISRLIAAPAAPWQAAGRFRGGDGLALADDLDVEIGGQKARGAVALRLLPTVRLDAALAAGRLDLDAWLPHLVSGGSGTLPTSVDISAEAADFAGGTLRHLRAAFDLSPDGARVREAEAVLPGDAAASLSGAVMAGRFEGTGHIDAPSLHETLRWLAPIAPALVDAVPRAALQTADLAASVTLDHGRLALGGMSGRVDGASVSGALAVQSGGRPALTGALAVQGADLDPWAPGLPASLPDWGSALAAWPGRWGGADIDLTLTATRSRLHGAPVERLAFDAAVQAGILTVRHGSFAGQGVSAEALFGVSPGGHVEGGVSVTLSDAAALLPYLPLEVPAALFKGQAVFSATGEGPRGAQRLTLRASLSGLDAEATGAMDGTWRRWTGMLNLRHSSAPRLLEAFGGRNLAPWLGEGPFSLTATASAGAGELTLSRCSVSAGLLHAAGSLSVADVAPLTITGQIDADTLPLPLPQARSADPLPVGALLGWRMQAALHADHVLFARSPALHQVAATLTLQDGVLTIAGLRGTAAGGTLTGQARLDAASPPRLTMAGVLRGATVSGPLLGGTLDLAAGRLDAVAHLLASGYSPAALLATAGGTMQLSVADGVLSGLDLGAAGAALDDGNPAAAQSAVAQALKGGSTPFGRLLLDGTVHGGTITVDAGTLTSRPGGVAVSGTLDLPSNAADLQLAFTPAHPGAPAIGLRLAGDPDRPERSPELAKLSGWLAER